MTTSRTERIGSGTNLPWSSCVFVAKARSHAHTVAVWIVAHVVPGISVSGPVAALIAAAAIGLINATIGLVLKIITFPLTLLTLGLFWFVINALMLELASALLAPGFQVRGFFAAFVGAI